MWGYAGAMTPAKALVIIRNFETGAFGKRYREGLEYDIGHGAN